MLRTEGVKMKSHRNTRPIDRYSNTLTKDTQSRYYHNQPELSSKNRYAKRDNVNPLVGTENLGDIRINRVIRNFKSSSTGHLRDF